MSDEIHCQTSILNVLFHMSSLDFLVFCSSPYGRRRAAGLTILHELYLQPRNTPRLLCAPWRRSVLEWSATMPGGLRRSDSHCVLPQLGRPGAVQQSRER